MGTNKRYPSEPRTWDPPWPPVQISDCEWVVVRNYAEQPAAVIKRFDATYEHTTYFRVVTWRPTSSGRTLIGRYETLREADRAVLFELTNSASSTSPPDQMWAKQRTVR